MPLISLAWSRRLAPWLRPLRYLCTHGWLREADVDFFLHLFNPALRLNRVFAKVLATRAVAEDMTAFTLRVNGNAQGWRAGQHVLVYLTLNGIRQSRSYSLTSVAEDGVIELAVKRHEGGRFSSALLGIRAGAVLELSSAQGELVFPADGEPVLLVAAGSGLTPLLGALREALKHGFSAPITLVHQVRRRGQRAFATELESLAARYPNLHLQLALSGEAAAEGELSRLQAEHLTQWPAAHLLACGPRGFIEQLSQWWRDAGRADSIQLESFSPPAALPTEGAASVMLGFARSGQQFSGNSAQSLLEQAEAHGLRPAHGCRQGVCTTCTCTLVSGTVRDTRSGALFAEPGQPIRICVSAPHGDVEIDL